MYELWHKVGLLKGKKTPISSKASEARVAVLETKTENCSNESLLADIKPKLITEIYHVIFDVFFEAIIFNKAEMQQPSVLQ